MSKNKIVIFGADRMAQILRQYLENDGGSEVAAFTVDRDFMDGVQVQGLPLVAFESIEREYPPDRYDMLVAVGYTNLNRLRAEKFHQAKAKGYELASYVNSRSACWDRSALGENCIIFENNVIQPGARVGDNVVIWTCSHVGRDTVIHDHCYVSSQAAINASVSIGPSCFVGSNTTFRDGVKVGRECIIGAGAVITRNTGDREVYVAQPTEKYRLDSHSFLRMSQI